MVLITLKYFLIPLTNPPPPPPPKKNPLWCHSHRIPIIFWNNGINFRSITEDTVTIIEKKISLLTVISNTSIFII